MSAENVDEKAESLHSLVLSKLDKFCPEKIRKIASDDQPFITDQLKRLDRKRRREYRKNRRSFKYKRILKFYEKKVEKKRRSSRKRSSMMSWMQNPDSGTPK